MDVFQFEERLNLIVPSSGIKHIYALQLLVDQAEEVQSDPKTAAAIFAYMERYPDADLGIPGPLVHFIEKSFPVYTNQLIESVRRRPVGHTLWMTNRILNVAIDAGMRKSLLDALKEAAVHPLASEDEREKASEYLELQDPQDA